MTGDLAGRVVVQRPSSGFSLDVSIDAPAGRTTAVLGPNGAGKSTLIAAICGLLPLDGGVLRLGTTVLDDPVTGVHVPAAARHVGAVLQGGLLFEHLDVLDNVAFGPRSRGAERAVARATAHTWLDRLDIAALGGRRPSALSGGQAQRVALARALATEPALLVLDEPFSALDVSGRTSLRRTLGDVLATFSGPRLLVTHDPTEAFLLADVLHVVEDGRTTQVGRPEEVRLRPATPYVADLADANLVGGTAADGTVDTGRHRLRIADSTASGEVLLTIAPRAVALHPRQPGGSPRNAWPTTVERVEHLGDRVRVLLGEPLPLTAEITSASARELDLRDGQRLFAAVKATEITVTPGAAGVDADQSS